MWGDTHADQGPGSTVVVTRGFAHGLVVIHGHSEKQTQHMASPDLPPPATLLPCPGRLPQGFHSPGFLTVHELGRADQKTACAKRKRVANLVFLLRTRITFCPSAPHVKSLPSEVLLLRLFGALTMDF